MRILRDVLRRRINWMILAVLLVAGSAGCSSGPPGDDPPTLEYQGALK